MTQFLSSRKIRQDLSGTQKRFGPLHWVPDICWRKFRDDKSNVLPPTPHPRRTPEPPSAGSAKPPQETPAYAGAAETG